MNTSTENLPGSGSQPSPLERVFSPQSIAVIGASADPAKRGNQAIRALKDAGYRKPIHAVNPRGGHAYGIDFEPQISDLPVGIDLALIALPGRLVPGALYELAKREVAGAVVLANGFSEAGPEGQSLDRDLRTAIAETGIRVVGPNTSGLLNVPLGANLVGLPDVPCGPISIITQSGNMLLSIVADNKAIHGPGFAIYIGLGNQCDVRSNECVRYLAQDPSTGAIAIHSEGLTDGRAFLEAAATATRHRPIVMLRGGRSDVGQRSALSHTASVAGSDKVATAVLRQAGIELVDRSDELAVISAVLATTAPVPAGTGIAILSDGGGHATLAADALAAQGVDLATLSDHTRAILRDLLGPPATVTNPIDVAGATDTDPSLFADAVDTLMSDESVGMVVIVGLFGGYHLRFDPRLEPAEHRTAERLLGIVAAHNKPLLVQSCYGGDPIGNHDTLRSGGVQVLASIDHTARATTALVRRGRRLATADSRSRLTLPGTNAGESLEPRQGLMDEPSARQLIEQAGVPVGPWQFARTAHDLTHALELFNVPCAVKVVSPQVIHKSDVGGVQLDITRQDGPAAWERIETSVKRAVPDAEIHGMIVTPMASSGAELLVGATRDPIFGPIVAFGSGGILVEALRDVTFRAAPFTTLEAKEMIEETMATRLLDGYRGLPAVNRDALADFLVRVGNIIAARFDIAELDLNPVIASGNAIEPVDVRIVLADPK